MKLNIDLGSDNNERPQIKEGFRTCKIVKAEYNKEWESIKLDLKCEGNLVLYPMVFPPEWKLAALFRTAGCKSADTDELVGKELPVFTYRAESGYLRAFDIFSRNKNYVKQMFDKSVKGGYIKLHHDSEFAEKPEVIEEPNEEPTESKAVKDDDDVPF